MHSLGGGEQSEGLLPTRHRLADCHGEWLSCDNCKRKRKHLTLCPPQDSRDSSAPTEQPSAAGHGLILLAKLLLKETSAAAINTPSSHHTTTSGASKRAELQIKTRRLSSSKCYSTQDPRNRLQSTQASPTTAILSPKCHHHSSPPYGPRSTALPPRLVS